MQSFITQPVARQLAEDRLRTARIRRSATRHRARPPGSVRRSTAHVVARVARRLDPEAARRVTAA
jgi:hypothetical protein